MDYQEYVLKLIYNIVKDKTLTKDQRLELLESIKQEIDVYSDSVREEKDEEA